MHAALPLVLALTGCTFPSQDTATAEGRARLEARAIEPVDPGDLDLRLDALDDAMQSGAGAFASPADRRDFDRRIDAARDRLGDARAAAHRPDFAERVLEVERDVADLEALLDRSPPASGR